jgi:hypothetical protein
MDLSAQQLWWQRCSLGLFAFAVALWGRTQLFKLSFNRSNIGIDGFIKLACLSSIELLAAFAELVTSGLRNLMGKLIDAHLPVMQLAVLVGDSRHQRRYY